MFSWDVLLLQKVYQKFLSKVKPLTVFINSRKNFEGVTPEMQEAIDSLKKELTSGPIMAHADFNLPFEIHSDSSPHAIGATLVQVVEGQEKVVMYISRSLKQHEVSYHQYEKEMLAVIWSLAVFRPYTIGREFKVVTDNKALTYICNADTKNTRLTRWVLTLNAHRIKWAHRSGAKHVVPDVLTRAFDVPSNVVYGKGMLLTVFVA